jgi:integrase
MTAIDSTPKPARSKPAKPCPEFPLFPHATGRWAKKIRGRLVYFGPWADPDAALTKYLAEKDDLYAGRQPRADAGAIVTVKDLANAYLNAKQSLVEAGELSPRTWRGYKEATDLLVKAFGKQRAAADLRPDDFAGLRNKVARKWGPVRLGNTVQIIRSVFKHAYEADLIDKPMRFGPSFKKPSRKTLRLHRAKQGPKLFSPEEIHRLVGAAPVQLRAMILLGVNCGFGNTDCGRLPLAALDLEGGWADYPRPKTGIPRRCPLWPETVAVLKEVLAARKEPKGPADAGLLFVTKYGTGWAKKDGQDSAITHEMRKLLNRLGINGHRNFYTLRHVFETVGGEAKDQVAVDAIMGHARDDMASVYREKVSDERLRAVTDHVRAWLFAAPKASGSDKAAMKGDEE